MQLVLHPVHGPEADPRCLANDNFIGYVDQYIVDKKVTWLEATIACPIFSGLVTYYVEGTASERGHLMEEALARPQRAWAVRGNLFSFLLPWESVMSQLSKCFISGDFREWPLDQATACGVCRVRFVRTVESVVDKFAELRVRSQVVKDMANIYIRRHIADLSTRPHVLKLRADMPGASLQERFKAHIDSRVDAEYPPEHFDTAAGAVPEAISRSVSDVRPANDPSAFDMKQSTMPDAPATQAADVFNGVRPSIVVDEGIAANTFSQETLLQAAAPKVAGMDIQMSNEFQDQFISQYSSRI